MIKKIVLFCLLPWLVFAGSKTWDHGCAVDSVSCAANWVGDAAPTSTDSIFFDSATSNGNALVGGTFSHRELIFSNYSGTMTISTGRTWTNTAQTSKLYFRNTGKYTLTGSGNILWNFSSSNLTDTTDNMFGSLSGNVDVNFASGATGICKVYIKRLSFPLCTSMTFKTLSAADTNVKFYFIGDTVRALLMKPGNATAGSRDSIFYGHTIFDLGAYDGTLNQTGKTNHVYDTAQFFISYYCKMPSADTATTNQGRSTWTFDSSTNTTLTPNGRRFFRIVNNKSGTGDLIFAAACTTSSHFTVTDGKLHTATYPIWSDSNVVFNCNDTVSIAKINAGKTVSFSANAIPKFTTDSLVADSIYYAATTGDSIRGDFKFRKMVVANGSEFSPASSASFVCTVCDGVSDLRDGKAPLNIVYPTSGPISYDSNNVHYKTSHVIDSLRPNNSGCSGTYYVDTLPDGLCISTTTGIITGIPTNVDTLQSIITITNTGGTGKDTVVFNITGGSDTIPIITAISPTHGTIGTVTTISGTIFGSSPKVFINSLSNEVTPVVGDSISAVFNAPSGYSGNVNFIVKNTTYSTYDTIAWSYDTVPNLVSLSKAYGKLAGGDTIAIRGTDMTGVDTAWINGNKATIISKANDSVHVKVPASATAGSFGVRTYAEFGYRDTLYSAYTYKNIWLLSTTRGKAKDTITVKAAYGLKPSTTCGTVTIGDSSATVVSCTDTTARVILPGYAAGTYKLLYTNSASDTCSIQFRYGFGRYRTNNFIRGLTNGVIIGTD